MITGKFHPSPFATYAISFRHEFAKLGTSAFQDTLWNFVEQILRGKPLKWMKSSASAKHWKPGFLDGVPGNKHLSIPNSSHDGLDDLLSGARHAIAKCLGSFYHDTIATAFKRKNRSTFGIHFPFLAMTPLVFHHVCFWCFGCLLHFSSFSHSR